MTVAAFSNTNLLVIPVSVPNSTFPLGSKAGAIVLLAVLSLILSLAGMGTCNFFQVSAVDGVATKWGFFWREETEAEDAATYRIPHCIRWSPDERELFGTDATWTTARAFAFLTVITIVCATGVILSLTCSTISKPYANLLGAIFVVASIFEVLTFIVVGSNLCKKQECTLSFGAGIAIGGITLCLLTAIFLFVLHPPAPRKANNGDQNQGEQAAAAADDDDDSNTHHEEDRHEEEVEDNGGGSDDAAAAPEDPEDPETLKRIIESFPQDV